MSESLVSVAIPAYKSGSLAQVIESVLTQNYSNLELIIVDDASPYGLETIVSSFKDSRIQYYKNKENLGKKSIVYNWNQCLSYVKGEFFVLLCDDDIMHPNFLSEMLNLAIKFPECDVFHSRTRLVDITNSTHINDTPIWPMHESFDEFLISTLDGKRHHTVSEFLYRTRCVRGRGGYVVFPAGYYSDIASVLLFAEHGGVCSSDRCLITFQKSTKNISSSSDYNVEKAKAALLYYDWLQETYPVRDKEKQMKQYRDFDLSEYYMTASGKDAMHILLIVPGHIWGLKKKLALVLKKLSLL